MIDFIDEESPDRRAFVAAQIERLIHVNDERSKPNPIGPSLPSWWAWRRDLVKVPGMLPVSRALAKAMGYEVGYVED